MENKKREFFVDGDIHLILDREHRLKVAKNENIITQEHFEDLVDEISTLRLCKVIDYGEDAYNEENFEIAMWGILADVRRKYQRMEKLIKNIIKNCDYESQSFRDVCRDLSNYGIMGIQIYENFNNIKEDIDE